MTTKNAIYTALIAVAVVIGYERYRQRSGS